MRLSRQASPKKGSVRGTYVIKLSKAYKTSSNVLKEIVNVSKEKYKYHVALQETVNELSHLVA